MSSGLYQIRDKNLDTTLDLTRLKPYGDTMNDGKVQTSFTLPVKDDDKGAAAAVMLAQKMGLADPNVALRQKLDENFTFYVVYGSLTHSINYNEIVVQTVTDETMDMHENDEFLKERLGRKMVVIGASTGTDAHTVGIDAIMNRKGFAGHYGLERYDMIEAYNLGSQVPNEEFLRKAAEVNADVLLVSQTVTQKDVHIQNLTELIELAEAEGVRDKYIFCCGGARITHALAKELGVSRQIIVGDVALLRAGGLAVLATPRGYVLENPASTPAQASMARATAAAAQVVSSKASWAESLGRSNRLKYSPVSGGEKKLWPCRPLPAVCSTAASTSPSCAPSSARWRRRVLVEDTVCATSTCSPGTVRCRAMLWGERRGLSTSKQYPRWETAWMGYPLSRSWEMAFHTALRLTWSCWARA